MRRLRLNPNFAGFEGMNISGRRLSGPTLFVLCLLVCSVMVAMLPTIPVYADSSPKGDGNSGCRLGSSNGDNGNDNAKSKEGQGGTQHVIYIQFDNTHFARDNPNVPSDLEQIPALLNFMEQNG